MQYLVQPGGQLRGELKVDGDKSISHRAIMFGSIAKGKTRIKSILEGEDVLATIAAFRKMGVEIRKQDDEYTVEGVGLSGLKQPASALDMGNSGTAFRLLTGLICGRPWPVTLCGDASLSGRPMGRIINPLSEMGAVFDSHEGKPPVTVKPVNKLNGIRYELPMASAQVKSAVLLAGLSADGETAVKEPKPTRDHTERMLRGFGYTVNRKDDWISLQGGGLLEACDIDIPSDLSSATFFIVATLISPGSEIYLKNVGINPSRAGVLSILQRMGGNITLENQRVVGGEPVADILVKHSELLGIDINSDDVALAVDEIPAIAIAAACAQGETHIRGAEELRVKESDRIATTVAGLRALQIEVDEVTDGMSIKGGDFRSGTVDSTGDHRIAMAFTVAGNVAKEQVKIENVDCIATSFPGFLTLGNHCGLRIQQS